MDKWMSLAIETAANNDFPGKKLAAVLVLRRGVVVGVNRLKTHPLGIRHPQQCKCGGPSACRHAEVDALAKALSRYGPKSISGSEIYIARVSKRGSIGLARPCKPCQTLLDHYGVRSVHYTS